MSISKTTKDFFIEQIGDTIIVEMIITKNPDKVIEKIMKSIAQDEEFCTGVKIKQLFFKGYNLEKIIADAKEKIIKSVMNELNKINDSI